MTESRKPRRYRFNWGKLINLLLGLSHSIVAIAAAFLTAVLISLHLLKFFNLANTASLAAFLLLLLLSGIVFSVLYIFGLGALFDWLRLRLAQKLTQRRSR